MSAYSKSHEIIFIYVHRFLYFFLYNILQNLILQLYQVISFSRSVRIVMRIKESIFTEHSVRTLLSDVYPRYRELRNSSYMWCIMQLRTKIEAHVSGMRIMKMQIPVNHHVSISRSRIA